eukprot:4399126-Prymnesium_polylepis.1
MHKDHPEVQARPNPSQTSPKPARRTERTTLSKTRAGWAKRAKWHAASHTRAPAPHTARTRVTRTPPNARARSGRARLHVRRQRGDAADQGADLL